MALQVTSVASVALRGDLLSRTEPELRFAKSGKFEFAEVLFDADARPSTPREELIDEDDEVIVVVEAVGSGLTSG